MLSIVVPDISCAHLNALQWGDETKIGDVKNPYVDLGVQKVP